MSQFVGGRGGATRVIVHEEPHDGEVKSRSIMEVSKPYFYRAVFFFWDGAVGNPTAAWTPRRVFGDIGTVSLLLLHDWMGQVRDRAAVKAFHPTWKICRLVFLVGGEFAAVLLCASEILCVFGYARVFCQAFFLSAPRITPAACGSVVNCSKETGVARTKFTCVFTSMYRSGLRGTH